MEAAIPTSVFLFSSVLAEEITCIKSSENTFTGSFSFNSYCEIPLSEYQGKIKVELSDGYYGGKYDFHIPVNAYIYFDEASFTEAVKKETQLKCSSYWGKTLDLTDNFSDSFPFEQSCGKADEFIGLGIDEPLINLTVNVIGQEPPFNNVAVKIKTELIEGLEKKYIFGRFLTAVQATDLRNNWYDFYFEFNAKTSETSELFNSSVPFTVINVVRDSVDYNEKKAVFGLINTNNGERLCTISTGFNDIDNETVDCKLAYIKIVGKKENPTDNYYNHFQYDFSLGLDPKTTDIYSNQPQTSENPLGNTTTTPQSNLTQAQTQLNSLILEKYYGEIFSLSRGEWPE